uniref:Peptidase A2 domain-containing protein n=1 Tax=Trichuris muris TaxID=70415 RepID=A0A5S6QAI4_TRIMR
MKHLALECRFKEAKCNFCGHVSHIAAACLKKKKSKANVGLFSQKPVRNIREFETGSPITQTLRLNGKPIVFKLDTGARDNFCSRDVWTQLGKSTLLAPHRCYFTATGDQQQILGICNVRATTLDQHLNDVAVEMNVTSLPRFNVLGRKTIRDLDIDIGTLLKGPSASVGNVHAVQQNDEPDSTCKKLRNQFSDLFKPELGCLKDFELEVSFKPDAKTLFGTISL